VTLDKKKKLGKFTQATSMFVNGSGSISRQVLITQITAENDELAPGYKRFHY
jgi:hypothetical protein